MPWKPQQENPKCFAKTNTPIMHGAGPWQTPPATAGTLAEAPPRGADGPPVPSILGAGLVAASPSSPSAPALRQSLLSPFRAFLIVLSNSSKKGPACAVHRPAERQAALCPPGTEWEMQARHPLEVPWLRAAQGGAGSGRETGKSRFNFTQNRCTDARKISMCACVLSHLSRLRLCDPMDRSPPGSSVHGILQARTLEWVAISSSRGSIRPKDQTRVSCLRPWQASSLPLAPPGKP